MERLSLLDAQFLHLEDTSSPMHIACLSVFEGPAPTSEQLFALFAAKLGRIPRYRQRVRFLPLELGRPVWIDDIDFDLAYHVRRTALPTPHDDAALCALMGRLMSQQLDRERPLWEAWVVEGLQGERWALVSKVHHCMVDGISGMDLLSALLDRDRHAEVPLPEPWTPAPEPSASTLVRDAWQGLAEDASQWTKKLGEGISHPLTAARNVLVTSAGLVTFARHLVLTAKLSIEGAIGAHRVYVHASTSLEDIRAIRKGCGGTFNDVVLAALSGGYRALLLHRGEDADHALLRSLVPVSVRTEEAKGVFDNRVSAVLCELPVHLADAGERLRAVASHMAELKGSGMAEAGEWLTDIGNLAPPMLVGPITRLVARVMHELPQRAINTVTTNVPGPAFPLYCLGREMLASYPYVPITQGLRIGIAVLSYNGQVAFGITGDYDTAQDLSVLAAGIENSMRELCAQAQATSHAPPA